jgi:hypothetical protein
MINRQALLADLQNVLRKLEADLLERSDSADVPEVGRSLRAEFEKAREAQRTAQNFADWRSDYITQVAAAWVLSCVFARFLEDNELIDPPKLAGPHERLARARDEHETYFRRHPRETNREYLLDVFAALAKLPGSRDVFGEHNPIHALPNWLGPDAASDLLRFFQRIDADTGTLVHDFTDPNWDTRFLGDLYQDLSETARKKYALLQTPDFVEEFILDRTLDPALDEFGLCPALPPCSDTRHLTPDTLFRIIDPACGSGHFLLGAFPRILDRWQRKEPATYVRELAQRALDSIYGVDVNPYAVAIARFRLLLAALRACNVTRLRDAPAFRINIACGDSLLHGPDSTVQQTIGDWAPVHHAYMPEDLSALQRILRPGYYHAVVANPPYITVKDSQLNQAYRKRYDACHRQYSLAVPFMQRLFQLSSTGQPSAFSQNGETAATATGAAGYVGQITANSFMKREFGKKLVEHFLPQIDLTHVIDTSGAYIPGHATPTVILFGRRRSPVASTIRTVMGIRGEPSTPDDASRGLVWSAIIAQIDHPGTENDYVSIGNSRRDQFEEHPWSIGGGGMADLKAILDESAVAVLSDTVDEIGFGAVTRNDDVFVQSARVARRNRIETCFIQEFITGENVRDWLARNADGAIWPYDQSNLKPVASLSVLRNLWPYRVHLCDRSAYGHTQIERGLQWFEYSMFFTSRFRSRYLIAFAAVATHNHFILSDGRRLFNRHAPIIKLNATATEEDHLGILGLLNSSVGCFWMKQVCNCKGLGGQGGGIKPEEWHRAFEFDGTKLSMFPLPRHWKDCIELSRNIVRLAVEASHNSPRSVLEQGSENLRERLSHARKNYSNTYRHMVATQEELDWLCYSLFGLTQYFPAGVAAMDGGLHPQDRPAEVLLRQDIAQGRQSIFYDVHAYRGAEHPNEMNPSMREIIQRRTALARTVPEVRLIESANYKRRWQIVPWELQIREAIVAWLLDRLEGYFDIEGRMNDDWQPTAEIEIGLISLAMLGDVARRDHQFQEVGAYYRDDAAFNVEELVSELVEFESVPLLPILRYKPNGLRKRAEWEKTWELQRREDAGEDVGAIPVPPKYTSADFISSGGARYWALRGKLDVPKERWVSFPHCEGPDGTLMIAWAGYDHLQLAKAVSAYYVRVQEELGGRDDPRLIPLLACLIELLPWLKQWHNEVDPEFQMAMGDYFEGFINEEARNLDKTIEEIKSWTPPARTSTRRRRRAAT